MGAVRDVCDVGGGPNPELKRDEIAESAVGYTLLDISSTQLAKAPTGYSTLLADITKPPDSSAARFDLVLSRWVAEHVPSGRTFHEGVRKLLKPKGYAVHLYPTLYAIPFLINKVLPEAFSYPLAQLRALRPGPKRHRAGNFGKFPAYYDWCYGPTERQLHRLETTGFTVVSFTAYFGHGYYAKLGPIADLEERLCHWLVKHPIPLATSSALVVLRAR